MRFCLDNRDGVIYIENNMFGAPALQSLSICRSFIAAVAMLVVAPAFGQAGLKLPQRGELGLDSAFAKGWLAPNHDGLAFSSGRRMQWSYSVSERSSLGLSYGNGRDYEPEQRQISVFGRYWLSPNWALSAESQSREPGGLLRLQDFRIGVHRRF